MNIKDELLKIKKRVKALHAAVIIILSADTVVMIALLIIYRRLFIENFIRYSMIALSCLTFMLVVATACAFIEKRIKRNKKCLVENIAGTISDEDKALAKELMKKWQKVAWAPMHKNYVLKIIEDLYCLKTGIKIDNVEFYAMLADKYSDETANPQYIFIQDTYKLAERNSYTLQE